MITTLQLLDLPLELRILSLEGLTDLFRGREELLLLLELSLKLCYLLTKLQRLFIVLIIILILFFFCCWLLFEIFLDL